MSRAVSARRPPPLPATSLSWQDRLQAALEDTGEGEGGWVARDPNDPPWSVLWSAHVASLVADPARLARGRGYQHDGRVRGLTVRRGQLTGEVSGEYRYQVQVTVSPVEPATWRRLTRQTEPLPPGTATSLGGALPAGLKARLCTPGEGLLPARHQLVFRCDCPDPAPICKHAIAVMEEFGQRQAATPRLLFTLRQVRDLDKPKAATGPAVASRGRPRTRPSTEPEAAAPVRPFILPPTSSRRVIRDCDLAQLFGVTLP